MKRQKKKRHCKVSPLGQKVFNNATGKEWRTITNSYRKNEAFGPKQKQHSVVDVPGGKSKFRCCKEQCSIETSNVRFLNKVNWKAKGEGGSRG